MSILNKSSKGMFRLPLYILALFQLGCATTTINFPDGTRTIGEVAHVLTRQEILTGDIDEYVDNHNKQQIKMPWLYENLLKQGLKDEEIVDGMIVLNRVMYSRFNVTSGIVRQSVNIAEVTDDLTIKEGNIVEVERIDNRAVIVRIRYKNLTVGQCEYHIRDRGSVSQVFDALNPIGGPAEASLYCPEIEKEGWYPVETTMGTQWFSKPPQE